MDYTFILKVVTFTTTTICIKQGRYCPKMLLNFHKVCYFPEIPKGESAY